MVLWRLIFGFIGNTVAFYVDFAWFFYNKYKRVCVCVCVHKQYNIIIYIINYKRIIIYTITNKYVTVFFLYSHVPIVFVMYCNIVDQYQ